MGTFLTLLNLYYFSHFKMKEATAKSYLFLVVKLIRIYLLNFFVNP